MSNSVPFRCPVEGCKFNQQISHADQFQIKRHIKHGHGYGELIETAVQLDVIRDENERRNPDWLTDRLADIATRNVQANLSLVKIISHTEQTCEDPL